MTEMSTSEMTVNIFEVFFIVKFYTNLLELSYMQWLIYALLSALFAALTTILAKIGIKNIDSNLATAVRTVVVIFFAWGVVLYQGTFKSLSSISKYSLVF